MKTTIVPLIGDPNDCLYQLGLKEKDAFLRIEKRITKLLSTNTLLQVGQDLLSRAKFILNRKKEESFFDQCIKSYSQGLGIDHTRYLSFLSLFELAAHYGQVYPELKGLLPGCTSVFSKTDGDFTHSRLFDFPLVGLFEETPRLYYWQLEGKCTVLSYSCEGLAPLFFQGVHGGGMSFALHHKPGKSFHKEGQNIFQIAFESLFENENFNNFKKEIKRKVSITKWSFLLLEKSGQVLVTDIEGMSQTAESYHLNDTSPLIFTNIPLKKETEGFESYLKFSEDRQTWLKEKLTKTGGRHILDLMTDVEDQKTKKWIHPSATLATVAAIHMNLTQGYVDVKEGDYALVASDALSRFSLANQQESSVLKEKEQLKPLEISWKRISKAQGFFDQGDYDKAYHELQMARAIMPNQVWKNILDFYLYVWDFKFISNSKELSLNYKKVRALDVPHGLKDQWIFLIMRMEKKLDLSPTVSMNDVSEPLRALYQQEKIAAKPLFATWMKLLYPRLEILDVFSPHHK
jgi:hypothetical protein